MLRYWKVSERLSKKDCEVTPELIQEYGERRVKLGIKNPFTVEQIQMFETYVIQKETGGQRRRRPTRWTSQTIRLQNLTTPAQQKKDFVPLELNQEHFNATQNGWKNLLKVQAA